MTINILGTHKAVDLTTLATYRERDTLTHTKLASPTLCAHKDRHVHSGNTQRYALSGYTQRHIYLL